MLERATMPVANLQALIDDRVRAIESYHQRCGIERAELDISGGIDSATMLALLARALGPDSITAVYSSINSSDTSRRRARMAAAATRVPLIEVDLDDVYASMVAKAHAAVEAAHGPDATRRHAARAERDASIAGSLRSCLRAPLGRYLNRYTGGGIRHGTGNEDEDRWLRFYQKGGDGEVDTNPIAMLSKGEVMQLAAGLDVPDEIVAAKPTPDLWGVGDEHNDEDELKALTGVHWTYSAVEPASGRYTGVGTIERLSRSLDLELDSGRRLETELFGSAKPDLDELTRTAHAVFPGFEASEVHGFLASARRFEAATRHKFNPNCPSLGRRETLVDAGVLSDRLPEVP